MLGTVESQATTALGSQRWGGGDGGGDGGGGSCMPMRDPISKNHVEAPEE